MVREKTIMELTLKPPIHGFNWQHNITQLFGVNYNLYKKTFNLEGHNGLDIIVRDTKKGYGTKILAAHDGTVRRIDSDFPTKTKGNGIYLRSDRMDNLGSGVYIETIYWHLSDFTVKVGDKVKAGDTIGLMGNTGWVIPRPIALRPYDGTHLHFGLKIIDANGVTANGSYGHFGYIDPTPYIYKKGDKLPMYWFKSLSLGNRSNGVAWLQTILKLEGFAHDYSPTGYYGWKTMRDVRKLQLKYGITPAVGFFGPITRAHVNHYRN